MATIVKQLKEAGVETRPVIQRVWQWVKDNGKHTSTEVADGLGVARNNASSTLGILCDRGMMTSKKEFSKLLNRDITYYIASPKMKKYELLPITAEAKSRPKRGQAKKKVEKEIFTVAGTAHEPPKEPAPTPHILDTMSVRAAYKLYQELHAMFNPKPEA